MYKQTIGRNDGQPIKTFKRLQTRHLMEFELEYLTLLQVLVFNNFIRAIQKTFLQCS